MSASIKRLRDKAVLKQTILDAAKDIAMTDGWQNVTIRKICTSIGYTAPVVYQHFENKEAILQAIRKEGVLQMFETIRSIHDKESNPQKQLVAFGLSYWKFAEKHPELYQVMFNLQGVVCCDEKKMSPLDSIIGYYKEAFQELNSKRKFTNAELLMLIDYYIAIIHGFISLNMVNKIRSGKEKGESVLKQSLLHFIKSV